MSVFRGEFSIGRFLVEYMCGYLLLPRIKDEIYIFELIERGSFHYCGGGGGGVFKNSTPLKYALMSRDCLFNRKKSIYMDQACT